MSAVRTDSGPVVQRGFSLIELMVALVISLVLLFGVTQLFLANKLTFRTQSGLANVQENGRYAVDILSRAMSGGGFFGCAGVELAEPKILDSATQAGLGISSVDAASAVAGENDVSSSHAFAEEGTDVITVRGAGQDGVGFTDTETAVNADVVVAAGYKGFADGDLIMITDCEGADIFQASTVSADGDTISHTANLSKRFESDALVMRAYAHTYYVADTGRNNSAGQDILALFRDDDQNPNPANDDEIIEGVTDLQVEYGIDQDGNRRADNYVDADSVTDWGEVVSARIMVAMSSVDGVLDETAPPYDFAGGTVTPDTGDRRLYKVFSGLVSLRNKAL